ncbi:MAG: T9SS type A sorting domain-containing protein [Bacteroidetes bacterium]|nr:T9SS type A sorting domain-containing protein [Bacteroidota bacterium]
MKRITAVLLTFILAVAAAAQPLDISGYKIVQANAALTITLPAGTVIQPGGYLVVARNTTKAAFETFFGITLNSNVVFINGFQVVGSNGFPSINGAETYELQNASSVKIEGPTIAMPAATPFNSVKRKSPIGDATLEASWTRDAVTAANPGTGMTNTNTGKLIISEFSDATAFANEFVELYYDAEPPPAGQGIGMITPARWKYNAGTTLTMTLKTAADTLKGFKVVKPSLFSWSTANISVQPGTASLSHSGDTTIIGNVNITSADSIILTITGVTATDSTAELTIPVLSSKNGTSYLPIQAFPKTLVYGSPRPIAVVKRKEANGAHSMLGKWAVVRGIVTVGNEFGGPTYLQDPTAGMALFDSSVSNNVNRGDDVVLLGLVAPFNDLFEFAPSVLLEKLGEGIGTDTTVMTIAQVLAQGTPEPQEGRLIRINGITAVTTTGGAPATSWATSASGTNYNITDPTGTLQVRIVTRTNIANTVTPTSTFDMVGVLGQFTTSYQLIPRMVDDIIVEGAGPRLMSQAPYETNITPTSLTISWVTDAPGTSIVKYGPTTAYGQEATDGTPKTQHAVTLTGLTPATVYHFQIGSANANGTTLSSDNIAITASQSSGTTRVYFNKSVNTSVSLGENAVTAKFDTVLINRINAAQFSIDFAAYSLSGTVGANIATALLAARNRGVKIRAIGEKDNSGTAPWTTLKNAGVVVIDDGYDAVNAAAGLMHNKFYVFDNRDGSSDKDDWVLTGSWNATDPGTDNDAQNIIVVQDKALATAFTMEFEEMWGANTDSPNAAGSRFGARKLDNTPHRFTVNGTPMELYFSPSDKVTTQINTALKTAQSSINVALLSFTRDELAQTIVAKKNAGLKTRVMMDNNTDSGNDFLYMQSNGIDIRLPGAALTGLLHHKYAVVDADKPAGSNIVVTGSHNWSSSAEIANNENTLIIRSKRIANLFLQEFKARYIEAGGTDTIVASVRRSDDLLPDAYALGQNYPNPFNPSTVISFAVTQSGPVSLRIYDVVGREVAVLVNGTLSAGRYHAEWNAAGLSSGVYFYQLRAGAFVSSRKMLLQK